MFYLVESLFREKTVWLVGLCLPIDVGSPSLFEVCDLRKLNGP